MLSAKSGQLRSQHEQRIMAAPIQANRRFANPTKRRPPRSSAAEPLLQLPGTSCRCTAPFSLPAMKPDSPPDAQAGKKNSADPKTGDEEIKISES
jgi:hypothetical protein